MKIKASWGNYYFNVTRKFMSDYWQVSYVDEDFLDKDEAVAIATKLAESPTPEQKRAIMEGRLV